MSDPTHIKLLEDQRSAARKWWDGIPDAWKIIGTLLVAGGIGSSFATTCNGYAKASALEAHAEYEAAQRGKLGEAVDAVKIEQATQRTGMEHLHDEVRGQREDLRAIFPVLDRTRPLPEDHPIPSPVVTP